MVVEPELQRHSSGSPSLACCAKTAHFSGRQNARALREHSSLEAVRAWMARLRIAFRPAGGVGP